MKTHTFSLVPVLLLILLTGCTSLVVSPKPTPTVKLEPGLNFYSCDLYIGGMNDPSAKCAQLNVPEDRSNPDGRMISLRLVVLPAKGPNPAPDPLVFLAGGPGDAATNFLTNSGLLYKQANQGRDIVYLDQRGTSEAHRLACDPIPFEVARASQNEVNAFFKKCLKGLPGDPRFYATAEAMRDLDEARAALGYDKLNLFGISYGVTAAQVYMRMFPEHVRSVVLDHGTSLDLPFFQELPRASQSALESTFSLCERTADCQAAFPNLRSEWEAVLARLDQGPVVTSFIPPEEKEPFQVTRDDVTSFVHTQLREGNYSIIPYMIHRLASTPDWTEIVRSVAEQNPSAGGESDFLLMRNIVMCFEPAWGVNPDEIARLNQGAYNLEPLLRDDQVQEKLCHALPQPDPALIYPTGKPMPINTLIFNGQLDPQNPPENMAPALKEFTLSRQVVEPNLGHLTPTSGCRWDLVTEFIQQGSAENLDVSCITQETKVLFVTGD
jgi:pimeloyl-ACP methyl ester carboxylesterase